MSLDGVAPPSVSLLNAQLLKPFSGSITGTEGMPGPQVKPLVSIAFERRVQGWGRQDCKINLKFTV